jgi:hypothetical protein
MLAAVLSFVRNLFLSVNITLYAVCEGTKIHGRNKAYIPIYISTYSYKTCLRNCNSKIQLIAIHIYVRL